MSSLLRHKFYIILNDRVKNKIVRIIIRMIGILLLPWHNLASTPQFLLLVLENNLFVLLGLMEQLTHVIDMELLLPILIWTLVVERLISFCFAACFSCWSLWFYWRRLAPNAGLAELLSQVGSSGGRLVRNHG